MSQKKHFVRVKRDDLMEPYWNHPEQTASKLGRLLDDLEDVYSDFSRVNHSQGGDFFFRLKAKVVTKVSEYGFDVDEIEPPEVTVADKQLDQF